MYEVSEAIEAKFFLIDPSTGDPATTKTVTVVVYDEADVSFATGSATEIAGGLYTYTFTPDAAGEWTIRFACADPKQYGALCFPVGKGIEKDIEDKVDIIDGFHDVPTADAVTDSKIRDVVGRKTDSAQTTVGTTRSIIAYVKGILNQLANATFGLDALKHTQHEVDDVAVYFVAEDQGTTEISDDGTSPALTAEVSKTNANEAAGMADPSWSEDINFEQDGTITVISIFYELHWQQKRTGGTTCSAKWQISRDGGSNWVDLTDNMAETGTTYADKSRIGVGVHIPTIVAGANQLEFRLCAWTDGTSVETKVRSDSYVRITYRKS